MGRPIDVVKKRRAEAVSRLMGGKFSAEVRVAVGSATCENAAGADAVHARLRELAAAHNLSAAQVALGRVGCAGKCDMEPIVTVTTRGRIPAKYVKMDPARAERVFASHVLKGEPVAEFTMTRALGEPEAQRVVSLCGAPSCTRRQTRAVEQAFRKAMADCGLADRVALRESACRGLCERGPIAVVLPDDVTYEKLTPEAAERIVREHLAGGRPVAEHLLNVKRLTNRFLPVFGDVSYFGKQLRMTLRNCGVIDPESIDEYLAVRGYEAAAKVLQEMTPEQVVGAVKRSGLRGRGGGGYPTGAKWEIGASQPPGTRYLICNADEGDPGAFMDRSTIEGDPHTIIEGMLIGSYAIGAHEGFVYIRAEYPLAVKRLEKAIADARAGGFLGKGVFGTGHDFDIEIRLGAGAFVCGEETALINSIEGARGMPDPRPPYPSVRGLWGRPTVINNVETFANVPVIILDGPEWFASIGTEKSKGTKVFALAGDVNNTGLIEVPMGTTLRDVVYDVGGGIKDGRCLKAVQTGGPAGGCIPQSMLDTPIDYDSLAQAGSIMGSGGMIVINDAACMVNLARFFLEFTQDESCGKCTPCREGTKRMLEILTRITEGKGAEGDLDKLLRLADVVKRASLCGLGQAAPNPVLSTIRHFREEYEAHVREKRCPAGVCRGLLVFRIVPEKCVGCGACKRSCPAACIAGKPKEPHAIDAARCVKCGRCAEVCKFGAVTKG